MKTKEKMEIAMLSHNTGIKARPLAMNNIDIPIRNRAIFDNTIVSCVNAKNVLIL